MTIYRVAAVCVILERGLLKFFCFYAVTCLGNRHASYCEARGKAYVRMDNNAVHGLGINPFYFIFIMTLERKGKRIPI